MKHILSWWAGNKVAANLLMVIILISGLLAFFMNKREINPYVEVPGASVGVVWIGASPQDVEEQIVTRLEEAVADIEGVDKLWSSASEGVGTVYINGKSNVNKDVLLQTVKRRVDSISTFPAAAEPPRVIPWNNRNEVMRIAVLGDVDERLLKRTAEKIRRELSMLPYIPGVETFGSRGEEVSIEVSEANLQAYGLSLEDVANAVRANSLNASSGIIRTQVGNVQLRTRHLADSKKDFENIIIRQNADGSTLRVKDIATVIDGFEQVHLNATMNGKPTILVSVMTGPNMDIVKMSNTVLDYVKSHQDDLPPGISMRIWNDNSKIYKDRMHAIGSNFFMGLILVFITLILFLRPIIAFWVAFGIAVAFAGGLALLPSFDVTFNMISTFAFLLVLGVIVDDAIIVGEAIHTNVEDNLNGEQTGLQAAVNGVNMVVKPVIFAALTTMIFFAPWMFLSGPARTFTRAISLVVILALTFSLIESLLILPAHLSHLKPANPKNPLTRLQTRLSNSLIYFAQKVYQPIIRFVLRRRYLTAAGFIAMMVLSIGLLSNGLVKTVFQPSPESDQITITIDLPQGTPYTRTLQVLKRVQAAERTLEREINTKAEDQTTASKGKLIENWYTRARDNQVLALVKLVPPETRSLSIEKTADRLRALIGDIPDAETIKVEYQDGDNSPAIQYVLNAKNPDALNAAAQDLMAKLRSFKGVYNVINDTESSADEILFDLKPGAQALGITRSDVARQLRNGFFGAEVQRLPRDGQDVRVFVRYPQRDRDSLEFLGQVKIRTQDGRQIPLAEVAELRFGKGVAQILRRERQRAIVVSAEVLPERISEIREALKNDFFDGFDKRHPEVTRGNIGRAEGQAQFVKELGVLGLLAIGIAYFLVAVAFRSYFEPLLILLAAIPFCFTGAMIGHLLLGLPLSLLSYLGISAAAGVAVNDNLVLLDYVHKLRDRGVDGAQALVQAGVRRFRPILLTSLTTFVGLLPLIADRSLQAKWLIPVGIGLAFGVLFALFVTLLFVPALYAIGADIRRAFLHLFKRQAWINFTTSLEQDKKGDEPQSEESLANIS